MDVYKIHAGLLLSFVHHKRAGTDTICHSGRILPRQNYNLITGFANHYLYVLNVKDSFVLPTFELIFHEYI